MIAGTAHRTVASPGTPDNAAQQVAVVTIALKFTNLGRPEDVPQNPTRDEFHSSAFGRVRRRNGAFFVGDLLGRRA